MCNASRMKNYFILNLFYLYFRGKLVSHLTEGLVCNVSFDQFLCNVLEIFDPEQDAVPNWDL
jgi:hypothetical protein